jgi:hypothetical protein
MLKIITGSGKLFKTEYNMPTISSVLHGTLNTPSHNIRIPRKPVLKEHF